ncbi:hypothetical protein [Larkinella sp. C7]|uniref:hypothetical protein n=1 Tax=Larkinella sp. C7 TaxID=2576607 RepID=UPI0011113CEE|nr:hypothetical protein [Larkinella sp. C7]
MQTFIFYYQHTIPMVKISRSLFFIAASLFINFACMQDHLPATFSYRPIDALVGSGSDRTESNYIFLGYQEGDLNQFDPTSLTSSTAFGLKIRTALSQSSWFMEGALTGIGYRTSADVTDPLYNTITDWKSLENVAGNTFSNGGAGLSTPDDFKFVKYFFRINAFRIDQIGGKTYLRYRAVAENETQPVGLVFELN